MINKKTNYSNGKIYKLYSNKSNICYIGSTTQSLNKRLKQHIINYKYFKEGNHNYTSSYNIIETNDYEIVVLEHFPCNTRQELEQRERFFIENLKCVNKNIPTRNKTEYRNDNIVKIRQHDRNRWIDRKFAVNVKRKKIVVCECGCKIQYRSLHRHKKSNRHKMKLQDCLID